MPEVVSHLSRRDPVLKQVIREAGPCTIDYYAPTFHALARSIVYQQLHGKAAATIFGRLVGACGLRTLTPKALLAVEMEALRAAGLSGQKAAYLRDLAEKAAGGQVKFARHKKLSDEEVIAELTQVKGIGVWTAQMYLMFALQRPDVFPVLDLGVRGGMSRAYGLDIKAKAEEFERIAEAWRPWRSVGSWYMWRVWERPASL
jgi:DNA-3-methyladenine glycosylase II